jgi:hypothetical protein
MPSLTKNALDAWQAYLWSLQKHGLQSTHQIKNTVARFCKDAS